MISWTLSAAAPIKRVTNCECCHRIHCPPPHRQRGVRVLCETCWELACQATFVPVETKK